MTSTSAVGGADLLRDGEAWKNKKKGDIIVTAYAGIRWRSRERRRGTHPSIRARRQTLCELEGSGMLETLRRGLRLKEKKKE